MTNPAECAADAEQLARLRESYDGCREVDEERRDGIGHVVFLLRLITNRDATIARLQQECDAATREAEALRAERRERNLERVPDANTGRPPIVREGIQTRGPEGRDIGAPSADDVPDYPDPGPALKRAALRSSRPIAEGQPSADDVERARDPCWAMDMAEEIEREYHTQRADPGYEAGITAFIANALEAVDAAARAQGRAQEREKNALTAFSQTSDDPQPGDWNDACEHIAAAIRALPGGDRA